MKLICRLVRIRLSRLVAAGEDSSADRRLAAHLLRCPECAREWAALNALADDLPRALPVLRPSTDFVVRTVRRLHDQPQPTHKVSWLPLPAAIALGAALVFFAWWTVRPTQTVTTRSDEVAATPVPAPELAPAIPEVTISQQNGVPQQVVSNSCRTPSSTKKVYPKAVIAVRGASGGPSEKITADQPAGSPIGNVSWKDWGDWYAEAGAYAYASDAYARAYHSSQDSSLAYATAYTAEAAGDVYQAITYYSQYLTQTDGT